MANFFSQIPGFNTKRPAQARRFFIAKMPGRGNNLAKNRGYCHVCATRLAQTFPQKSSIYKGSREVCATFATFATTFYNIYL